MRKILLTLMLSASISSLSAQQQDASYYPKLLSEDELLQNTGMLGGIYYAYPLPNDALLTPAPEGYKPFYISHYGRHGSRYQPNNTRYVDTRHRLREAQKKGRLTTLGESVLKRIEVLCDSCIGHGGLLTTVGARQQKDIGQRMYERFKDIFTTNTWVSARASVVKRCGQSMNAFVGGLTSRTGSKVSVTMEVDSAFMRYIAYDSPDMKMLASKDNEWWKEYQRFIRRHVDCEPLMKRLFTDATDVDTLQATIDLYWLVVGMQNLDMCFNLDDVFTPEELMACWQCVNYRMYVCNGNAMMSDGIPAKSASSLLRNIVETADDIISGKGHDAATLRFGHDSNLLRLLSLMKIHNCANAIAMPEDAWKVWQESMISPMGANLQLVFFEKDNDDLLVKLLLNEHETIIDAPSLTRSNGVYYRWKELRTFFLQQTTTDDKETEFVEPVQ